MSNEKPKSFAQYEVVPPIFDAYSEASRLQETLGSVRTRRKLEAASLSSTNYQKGVSGWRLTPSAIEDTLSGVVAPTSTPEYLGQKYIDTVAGKVYIATGTASSANWVILN